MRFINKKLIVVIVFALVLRIVGTNPGYPPFHTDEGVSYSQAVAMIEEHSLDPKNGYGYSYNYPILVPLVNTFFYLIFFIPVKLVFLLVITILNYQHLIDTNLFGSKNLDALFWSRYISAFFGVGIVLLTYVLSQKLFKQAFIAILSAFLVAINFREVLNSHFGLPDIYNSFTLLLSLILIVSLWKKTTVKNFILAGLGLAIYFCTKWQLFAFPAIFLVLILNIKKNSLLKLFLLLLSFTSLSILLNYFVITHLEEAVNLVSYTALKYRYGRMELDLYPIAYLFHFGIGPAASIMVLIGVFAGLFKKTLSTLLLLIVAVPFMWFFTYYTGGGYYTRNFITIIPVLLIFASLSIYELFMFLRKINSYLGSLFFLIVFILISYQSLSNSIIVPIGYSKKWNFKSSDDFVNKNVKAKSRVISYQPISLDSEKYLIVEAQDSRDYLLAELQDLKIDYALISLDLVNANYSWWMTQDTKTSFKFWNRPDQILLQTPGSKIVQELKNYVVFESLGPWQAPQPSYLLIKVPEKINLREGKGIYSDDFKVNSWQKENDGFGNMNNFIWDKKIGFKNKRSLKIEMSGNPFYSQRFFSSDIEIQEQRIYKVVGKLKLSNQLAKKDRSCFFGVDFFDKDRKYITSALSSYIYGDTNWQEKEITATAPKGAKFIRVFFQMSEFNKTSCYLGNIEVREGSENKVIDNSYIKSFYNPIEHLFTYSNAGL